MDKQTWINKVIEFLEDMVEDGKRLVNETDDTNKAYRWFQSYAYFAMRNLLEIPNVPSTLLDELSESNKIRLEQIIDTEKH